MGILTGSGKQAYQASVSAVATEKYCAFKPHPEAVYEESFQGANDKATLEWLWQSGS
jgi:hypothetical protein